MKSIALLFLFLAVTLTVAPFAIAGETVAGSGATKASAADDANKRAAELAKQKGLSGTDGTCYTPAKIEECKKDSDGNYVCTAVAANHHGSCRR